MNALARRESPPLGALLHGIHDAAPNLQVKRLCTDSRQITPGDVFVALRGHAADGRAYLAQAEAAGAAAALVEDSVPESVREESLGLPLLVIPGLRQHLGDIASRYFGNPSHGMHITAVTGTNGKTTVSQLFAQLVRASGYACGVIGTLGLGYARLRPFAAEEERSLTTLGKTAAAALLALADLLPELAVFIEILQVGFLGVRPAHICRSHAGAKGGKHHKERRDQHMTDIECGQDFGHPTLLERKNHLSDRLKGDRFKRN